MRRLALLGLALALAGCAGTSAEVLDDTAQAACAQFAEVADDVGTDRLTGPPLYRALQEVYDEARVSADQGFAEQARLLVSAAINEDAELVAEQVLALRSRCRLPGA